MGRTIGAVVVGYVVMFVVVFVLLTAAYFLLGAEGSFEPGSYDITATWAAVSVLVSVLAAIAGGWVCRTVARERRAVMILAGLVLVLGYLLAIPALMGPEAAEVVTRGPDIGMSEAMMNARTPVWLAVLNPLIGAIGALIGGRIRAGGEAPAPSV